MAQDSWDDPVLAQSMGRATRPKPRKSYALESEESEFSDVSAMGEEEDVNPFGQDEDDDDEDADDGVPLSLTPRLSPDTIKSTARKQTSRPSRAGAKKVSRPKPRDESEDDLSGLGSEDVDADEEMELDADGDVDAFGEADDSDDAFYDDDDAHIRGGMPVPPDMSKLTKRQRAQIEAEPTDESYLQLPMERGIKKQFTAEEQVMRRAEMARRRKNLSRKRDEEEKEDTINRLLKKQAPKRRGKISAKEIEQQDRVDDQNAGATVSHTDGRVAAPPNPVFTRYISRREGSVIALPNEWLDSPLDFVTAAAKLPPNIEAGST